VRGPSWKKWVFARTMLNKESLGTLRAHSLHQLQLSLHSSPIARPALRCVNYCDQHLPVVALDGHHRLEIKLVQITHGLPVAQSTQTWYVLSESCYKHQSISLLLPSATSSHCVPRAFLPFPLRQLPVMPLTLPSTRLSHPRRKCPVRSRHGLLPILPLLYMMLLLKLGISLNQNEEKKNITCTSEIPQTRPCPCLRLRGLNFRGTQT